MPVTEGTQAERIAAGRARFVAAAFDRGLVLLSCGLYGNVIRCFPRSRSPRRSST